MEKLKLIPQAIFKDTFKEQASVQYANAEEIKEIFKTLIKNIERLEDKITEIEYRLKYHINTFDDIAHRI